MTSIAYYHYRGGRRVGYVCHRAFQAGSYVHIIYRYCMQSAAVLLASPSVLTRLLLPAMFRLLHTAMIAQQTTGGYFASSAPAGRAE